MRFLRRRQEERDRLQRIETRQEEIAAFLGGKVAMELESICQAVHGQHAEAEAATPKGDGDARLADEG